MTYDHTKESFNGVYNRYRLIDWNKYNEDNYEVELVNRRIEQRNIESEE